MTNLKNRMDRLEGRRKRKINPIIVVEAGETEEEAWQKYLAENPEIDEKDIGGRIIIMGDPDASPDPSEPETQLEKRPVGVRPMKITW